MLGFVPSFLLSFLVGEGLISALGYEVGGSTTPPLWALLTATVPALAVFAVQTAWSPWWLARHHFGPVEWAWRSLTYGRPQPMRIPRVAARPGLAA